HWQPPGRTLGWGQAVASVASPPSLTSQVPGIVFVEPRIPPNTGNAIRLAAATGATLHLVEPLGFELDEPRVKRAGLDYHDLAHVRVHESFDSLCDGSPDSRVLAFTTGGKHSYADIMYKEDD